MATTTTPGGGSGGVAPSQDHAQGHSAPSAAQTTGAEAMTITVYSKPACVQCTATTRALDARGLDYSIIDLTQDEDAMQRATALGYRQVPVVVAGEDHWAGFRPDMIGRLA